jgi:hypothetical protein
MGMEFVLCTVETESLNVIQINFSPQRDKERCVGKSVCKQENSIEVHVI